MSTNSGAVHRAKRAVKKGDILFSTVRPNLKAYGYALYDCDLFCPSEIIRPTSR